MKAVRFMEAGKGPEVVQVETPTPGPGEVLLKVGGAGVCHSDLHILDLGIGIPGPFTLGHENAGWVAALGAGVHGWREGDAAAVYGSWGCGHCHACAQSMENYCENAVAMGAAGGGIGCDGGMADYLLVPSARLLVPLGKLEPKRAAPLTDAALTPYHAIKRASHLLTPDATVVIIGVGGLGHMGVQLVRCLSAARIIAVDVDNKKLAHATSLGADLAVNALPEEEAVRRILDFCGPRAATLVLDFVGSQPSLDLASKIVGRNSQLTVVGLAGGTLPLSQMTLPFGCSVCTPYWGTKAELMEVIALAQNGRIHVDATYFSLDEGPRVMADLREGKFIGRAVLVPG